MRSENDLEKTANEISLETAPLSGMGLGFGIATHPEIIMRALRAAEQFENSQQQGLRKPLSRPNAIARVAFQGVN